MRGYCLRPPSASSIIPQDAMSEFTRYFQEKYETFEVVVSGRCKSARGPARLPRPVRRRSLRSTCAILGPAARTVGLFIFQNVPAGIGLRRSGVINPKCVAGACFGGL